jgi:hypothetical protein
MPKFSRPGVHPMIYVVISLLLGLGLLIAIRGLVYGEFTVTQGPKRGPPHTVWSFTGSEALRVGVVGVCLAVSACIQIVTAWKLGRHGWHSQARSLIATSLGVLFVGTLLALPLWQWEKPDIIAGFYGFLVPALIGAWRSLRGKLGLLIGMPLGVACSMWLGYGDWLNGQMPALLAFLLLGTHMGVLLNQRFRQGFLDALLS